MKQKIIGFVQPVLKKMKPFTDKIKPYTDKIKPYRKNILWLLAAALTTTFWYIDSSKYALPKSLEKKRLAHIIFGKMYLHLRYALTEFDILSIVLMVALYFLYAHTPKYKGGKRERGLALCFSFLIPFVTLLCQSYSAVHSWNYVFGGFGAVLLSLVKIAGFGLLVYAALCFLSHRTLTVQRSDSLRKPFRFGRDMLANTAILLVFWAPYTLFLFPGCFSADGKDQLAQAISDPMRAWTASGINLIDPHVIINTHHPVFYTYLLKGVIRLAWAINSYDWAFELLCVGQMLLLAASFGYLLATLKRYGARTAFVLGAFVFFAVNPLFPIYSMTVIKDTIHSAVMVFAFVLTYEILTVKKVSYPRAAAYFAAMLLLALTRNNIAYLFIPFLLCLVIYLRKDKDRMLKTGAGILASVLIVFVVLGMLVYPAMRISKGSSRELLAVPINQTARYVYEHKDEITPEEEQVILKIFSNNDEEEGTSLALIAKRYDPELSDPVKEMYDRDTTVDDLKDYFKVWLAQLKKHPDTYVQAYLNIHYGWFSFEGNSQVAYSTVQNRHIGRMVKGFTTHMGKEFTRDMVNYFTDLLLKNPLTVVFMKLAGYTWFYIILLIHMLKHKKWTALLTCALVYFNYLIYFIGPVAYMRYGVPMACVAPFALFIAYAKNEKRVEDL